MPPPLPAPTTPVPTAAPTDPISPAPSAAPTALPVTLPTVANTTAETIQWFTRSYPTRNLGVGESLVFEFAPIYNVNLFNDLGEELII